MLKRIIAILSAVAVLCCGFSVTAETSVQEGTEWADGLQFHASGSTVYDVMLNAVMNHQSSVNVRNFNIPKANAGTVFYNFYYNYPQTFVMKTDKYTYNSEDGYIYSYFFEYYDTAAVAAQKLVRYNAELDKISAAVPKNGTTLDKVIAVYDYVITHFQYDRGGTVTGAYDFLIKGTGVCEGYTKTITAMMNRLGIANCVAYSKNCSHKWNIVKLGTAYYHIDATYDDPVADRMGQARHRYFLLSTSTMISRAYADDVKNAAAGTTVKKRDDWTVYGTKPTCSTTTYESTDYVWSASRSPMAFIGGNRYIMIGKVLYSVASNMKTKTTLYTQSDSTWYVYDQPTKFWTDYYGSLFAVGDVLYGNTQKGIWWYKPSDKKSGKFAFDSAVGKQSIYGSIYAGNGVLKLQYAENPNTYTQTVKTYDLPRLTDSGRSYTAAMLNVYRTVLYGNVYHDELLDVTDDGVVNVLDLVRIKKKLAS